MLSNQINIHGDLKRSRASIVAGMHVASSWLVCTPRGARHIIFLVSPRTSKNILCIFFLVVAVCVMFQMLHG